MQYRFTLKDNNQKAYNMFVWFLFFLHIVVAAWIALKTPSNNIKWSMYILLGTYGLISMGYFFFRKKTEVLEAFSLLLALFYTHFWFTQVGIFACLIFILIFLFAYAVKGKKTTVSFSETGVYLTRVFKTVIFPWAEMDNVILKDNLLTIDFKSNKIIQAEIVEETEIADEISFNRFCTAQLQNKD